MQAGTAPLFEDVRIRWALSVLGGVEGKRVLELGPLEGGHSYMLERSGAESVLAIEGNKRAFLRCLIVKEVLGLKRIRFEYGDFVSWLRGSDARFDVIFASGVLYHVLEPMELLRDLAARTDALFLWTHYYDPLIVKRNAVLARRCSAPAAAGIDGLSYEKVRYDYEDSVNCEGFCGGSNASSCWIRREDIVNGLRHFGFTRIVTEFDHPEHPNGPAFALLARRD